MKSRNVWLIIGVVIVLLICCVCIVAAVVAYQSGLLSFLWPSQSAATIMPADTPFLLLVNPTIQNMAGYQHLAEVYGDMPEVESSFQDMWQEVEGEYDISFETDIQPWMGSEIALGMTDLQELMGYYYQQPTIMLVVTTRDHRASDSFLDKLYSYLEKEGYELSQETYRDVTIHIQEAEYDWETPTVIATVDDFVVMTTSTDAMKDIIDVAQGNADALAADEGYTRVMDALPENGVGYIFYDLPALMESIGTMPGIVPQMEGLEGIGMAVHLDSEGVLIESVVTFDPDKLPPETMESLRAEANAGRLIERVPADAVGFMSGQNLGAWWRNILASFQQNPDFAMQLEDLERELGLRLNEELLGWQTGEYTLVVTEVTGNDSPIGLYSLLEFDDAEAAGTALDNIFEIAGNLGGLGHGSTEINQVEMQTLYDWYSEEVILGYGLTDEYVIIGFPEEALETATGEIVAPIAGEATFQRVRTHLPDSVTNYVYVDAGRVWQLIYETMSPWDQENFDQEMRPFLEPIEAIGIASPPADLDRGISRGSIYIYIP